MAGSCARGADPIRAAPAADAQSAATVAAATSAIAGLSPEDQQRLDTINIMLDEEVRPYLQSDGGDLHVLGLDGNKLSVHYQGACGTCPSSISGTLRGIQNMLRSIEPIRGCRPIKRCKCLRRQVLLGFLLVQDA